MKTEYSILILFVLISALCIWDIIYTNRSFDYMEKEGEEIYVYSMQNDVDYEALSLRLEKLHNYWNDTEGILCLIISRKDMQAVGEQLEFLCSASSLENKEEVIIHSRQFYFSIISLSQNTRLNIRNIL